MGRLLRLEVENFKSYKGKQILGPFHNFTSVIGPNGSGKSNLMDAISFVLGVKSSQLRSTHLKELVYRGHRARKGDEEGGADDDGSNDDDDSSPKRGHVAAIYEDDEKEEISFMRTIIASGASEYKINNRTVTYAKYNAALEKENIIVKAKNFLVFQGDVEAIASQSPRDLTRLIEQISGSLEVKAEYERLKADQEKATENSTHNFNKKRGISAEMKQFKEQREEAKQFDRVQTKRDKAIVTHLLWKLYHIEEKISELDTEIQAEKDSLVQQEEEA
ncbi:P-loop containing nucleoside triphosphate hydrolase protein, partial [Blyttiomyces helicus]